MPKEKVLAAAEELARKQSTEIGLSWMNLPKALEDQITAIAATFIARSEAQHAKEMYDIAFAEWRDEGFPEFIEAEGK